MKTLLRNIATLYTGVYAKPTMEGDALYLQANWFDEDGNIKSKVPPNIKLNYQLEKHLLSDRDVLFASKGVKNFAATYKSSIGPAVASSTFLVMKIRDRHQVLPEYVAWYLNHPYSQQFLKMFAKGTNLLSITKEILGSLEITIPNLEKQRLIVRIHDLRNREKKIKARMEGLKEKLFQEQLLQAAKN